MKPELKAFFTITDGSDEGFISKQKLCEVFLSALHWRGDELWCGPFMVGEVRALSIRENEPYAWNLFGVRGNRSSSANKSFAALEAAAREQITKWFEEQKL